MRQFIFLFFIANALVFMAGCRKNIDITTIRELGKIPVERVQCTLTGLVTDLDGNPVENASVYLDNNRATTTNSEGLFFYPNTLMDQNGALVYVSKPGFFTATRFAFNRLGGKMTMTVQLIPKNLTGSFAATAGGIIETPDGAKITIPANAVTDTYNDIPYTGQVNVYAVYLAPENQETYALMPGDLRAQDSSGLAKILKTFGMIGVELESPDGKTIQIINGKKANISVPLNNTFLSVAPASIPLWHFDIHDGYWKEEGSATLAGNRYEGEVRHFSFWNYDIPSDAVIVRGRILDQDGDPMMNMYISARAEGEAGCAHGRSDSEGYFCGLMPANEDIVLSAFADNCRQTPLQSWDIGPFSTDTELPDRSVTIADELSITVFGQLEDCTGNPLTDGIVLLNGVKAMAFAGPDGKFKFNFTKCSNASIDVQLKAYHLNSLVGSDEKTITVTDQDIDVGNIRVCSGLDEYVALNLDGQTFVFPLENYVRISSISGEGTIFGRNISANVQDSSSNYVAIDFRDFNPQTNEAQAVSIEFFKNELNNSEIYKCIYGITPDCNCGLTEVGPIQFSAYPANSGDLAIGTVSGQIKNAQSESKPFSIVFRVRHL